MCAVAQNGLAPVGDGPPAPEDYSTACSCSDLVHSFASVIPSPYRYLHTLTAFETYTTPTDPNYLYVKYCAQNDSCPTFPISELQFMPGTTVSNNIAIFLLVIVVVDED